jgi:diadenosine tetraphosphate (Ap4A) HIT family hydrolase
MEETIFDKILNGKIRSWKVWEDESHLAFLTPFPNTPGLTVVIPKKNIGDYIFNLSEAEYSDLLTATRTVAKILEKAFNTSRIALVFEGTGVAHVHAKLLPLHGELANQTNVWSPHTEFNQKYLGYLTTAEGPKMNDSELDRIQRLIKDSQT